MITTEELNNRVARTLAVCTKLDMLLGMFARAGFGVGFDVINPEGDLRAVLAQSETFVLALSFTGLSFSRSEPELRLTHTLKQGGRYIALICDANHWREERAIRDEESPLAEGTNLPVRMTRVTNTGRRRQVDLQAALNMAQSLVDDARKKLYGFSNPEGAAR